MKITKKEKAVEVSRVVLILASIVVVIAGLKASADFLVPVLLAFFIATVSFPVTNWLREHRVPRVLAVFITVLVDFAFLAGVVLVGILLIGELQTKWETKYHSITKDRITQLADNTGELIDQWGLNNKGKNLEDLEQDEALAPKNKKDAAKYSNAKKSKNAEIQRAEEENSSQAGIELFRNELMQNLSVNKVVQLGTDLLGHLISFLGTTFIVMLLTVFMLSEARMFGRRFSAISEARGPNFERILSATKDIQRYLGIKAVVSLMTGFFAGILCWGLGLELPFLWAIIAFALNFIPAIGSVVAAIPPILLSLLLFGDWKHASMVAGGYLLINGFFGNFLEPMLQGRCFGISSLVVIISVIFWGWLWGPIGMLLSIPLTMLVKVALDHSSDLRWVSVAISKEEEDLLEIEEIISKEDSQKVLQS